MTTVGPHLFWITSRASGTTALILSSAAVGAGLLVGRRGEPRRGLAGGDAKALHEALALATLVAVAIHGLTLLGDRFLHPTVLDISVPFSGAYRPFWTGIGITAGWGLAALGLSYYARSRVGQARWRSLHRFTAAFWALGIAHSLGSGTDAGRLWFLLAVAIPTVPALILLLAKLVGSGSGTEPERAPPRRSRVSPPPHPAAGVRRPEPLLSAREG
jgi:sulfoxide reductase heme-binding subunit YedZ